jgi:hypothetical protein
MLDQNRLVVEWENEKKARQSTSATIIDRVKVMSYENTVEAQRTRHAGKLGDERKAVSQTNRNENAY